MSRRGTLIGFVSLCLSSPVPAVAEPTASIVHVDPAPVAADAVDEVMRRVIRPRMPSAADVVNRLLHEANLVLRDLEEADRASPAVAARAAVARSASSRSRSTRFAS